MEEKMWTFASLLLKLSRRIYIIYYLPLLPLRITSAYSVWPPKILVTFRLFAQACLEYSITPSPKKKPKASSSGGRIRMGMQRDNFLASRHAVSFEPFLYSFCLFVLIYSSRLLGKKEELQGDREYARFDKMRQKLGKICFVLWGIMEFSTICIVGDLQLSRILHSKVITSF